MTRPATDRERAIAALPLWICAECGRPYRRRVERNRCRACERLRWPDARTLRRAALAALREQSTALRVRAVLCNRWARGPVRPTPPGFWS